jgi:two-component system, NtrC family, response regulator AtoC
MPLWATVEQFLRTRACPPRHAAGTLLAVSPSDLNETLDVRQPAPQPGGEADRLYLLVLEGASSALCPLPRNGSLVVGRAPDADLQVKDPSVSRHHARLVVVGGEVHVADLGSHNGVRVNGEFLERARPLQSGDVVTLGAITLVFHRGARPQPVRPVLDALALRDRLNEELERVQRYERTVGVVALELGPTSAPTSELVRAAGSALRLMDLVGQAGALLLAVLPEADEEEVTGTAQQLLEALAPLAPELRAGVATAPQDGMDADALVAAARAAALAASPGKVRASGPNLYQLTLGERQVVVADSAMVRLYELLQRLASSPLPVLIHGETGTGKENAAWAVHHWSPRAGKPFIALNCAALPENLVESELFGYERGAFSGADKPRSGLLENASGGTLFMDEVAELPLPVQAKLLRALEQQRITRLGDSRERPVDIRVVAATHRVLADEVKAGRFRQDLFFRLSAAVVHLPPLRDRARELPLLARAFLQGACERAGRAPLSISASAMGVLSAHPWPGNVRELKNAMEYVAATAPGPILEPSNLPDSVRSAVPEEPAPEAPVAAATAAEPTPPTGPGTPLNFRPIYEEIRELERQRMSQALEATGGIQTRAAQLIGMPLRTFVLKLKQYGLASRGK